MEGEKGSVTIKNNAEANNKNNAEKIDIFDNPIVNYMLKTTISPELYIKAVYLAILSHVLGQYFKIKIPLKAYNDAYLPLNLWFLLVGHTGLGKTIIMNEYRKIIGTAERFYHLLDPELKEMDSDDKDKKIEIIGEIKKQIEDMYIDKGSMEGLARFLEKKHREGKNKFIIVNDEMQTILKSQGTDYMRRFLEFLLPLYDGTGSNFHYAKESIRVPGGLYITSLCGTQDKPEIMKLENFISGYMRRAIPIYCTNKNGDDSEPLTTKTDEKLDYIAEAIMLGYAERLVEDLKRHGYIVETISVNSETETSFKKIMEIIRNDNKRIEELEKENDERKRILIEGKKMWLAKIIGVIIAREYVKELLRLTGDPTDKSWDPWEKTRNEIREIIKKDIEEWLEALAYRPKAVDEELINEWAEGEFDKRTKDYLEKLLSGKYVRLNLISKLRKHYRELLERVKNGFEERIRRAMSIENPTIAGVMPLFHILNPMVDARNDRRLAVIIDQVNGFLDEAIGRIEKLYEKIYILLPSEEQEKINYAKKKILEKIKKGEKHPCAVSATYFNRYIKIEPKIKWRALYELVEEGHVKIFREFAPKNKRVYKFACVDGDCKYMAVVAVGADIELGDDEIAKYFDEKLRKYKYL